MSIEKFFAENKPGYEFIEFIDRRIKLGGNQQTRIGALAQLYRQVGSEHLRELTKRLSSNEGGVLSIPNAEEVMSRFNSEQISSWGKNTIAILFGCAIPTIEVAVLRDGFLDMKNFWGYYDNARTGTILPNILKRNTDEEMLSPSQWGQLGRAIRENPTYNLFLEQGGLSLLPSNSHQSLNSILGSAYDRYDDALNQFRKSHQSFSKCLYDLT